METESPLAALEQQSRSFGVSPSFHRKRPSEPTSILDPNTDHEASRRRLFEESSQLADVHLSPCNAAGQLALPQPGAGLPPLFQLSAVPDTQYSQEWQLPQAPPEPCQQLWTALPTKTRQTLSRRLITGGLRREASASGYQVLQLELHAQGLFGARSPLEDACWLDDSAIWTRQANQLGVARFHSAFGDIECAQMLKGLLHMMQTWRRSPDGLHYLDEQNKRLSGTKRSGKGGPAACIMKRLLALTKRRTQLSQHVPVLKAFQQLVGVLQQRLVDCLPAGMYSYELKALVHQVLTVQQHWRSESGLQYAKRAAQMLHGMVARVTQLAAGVELNLEQLMQQLLDDFHPQTELVQERLKRHVQHLLKFGRDTYDKLQYDAVTADINQPLMINAGPGSGKTTVMALRALYLIGCLLNSDHALSSAYDNVVALTFSRRAQQHMKQTLDGMCVRVTHNHTFDGLWLKMANEFRRHLSKVLIKVVGQDEVKACLSKNIEEQMEVFYNQGRCRFKAEGASWKDLLDTISELLAYQLQEMFVAKAGLHVYTFRDAWAQPTARREMWEGFVNNPQLGSSIYSSQLPVNAKDLQPVVLQAVTDFVASFQEGDAAVWELLGYATRIWHIASQQLPVTPTEKLAADRIFSYWTSREAWLLDEFQDVSHAQYRLLRALTGRRGLGGQQRVTIVGDADQAIYDWRGADVQIFEEQFEADFHPLTKATLIINYRSTPQIVNRSNALIAHNYTPLKEALQYLNRATEPKPLAAAAGSQHDQPVRFVQYANKEAQAAHILSEIRQWHAHGTWGDRTGALQGPGVPYSQIRVLARAKWQLWHLKSYLDQNGLQGHVTLVGDNSASNADDSILELSQSEEVENKDEQIVLSSVHAVKGLECVVCFVVGLDQKAWRFRSDPQVPSDVQQIRESRNVAYVAMTRAERVMYLAHIGPASSANTFFTEAMLGGDQVLEIGPAPLR